MIRRTMDPAFLTEVANHPAVRPWICGPIEGPLDLTVQIADPVNITLVSEHGGFGFHWYERGVYELHSLFLPGYGSEACRALREAVRFMFARTDCTEILTRVAIDNRPAEGLARVVHFQKRFERVAVWPSHGAVVDMEYYGLTLQHWALTDPAARKAGETFHVDLEAAKKAAGSTLPTHPEDVAHNCAVGAFVMLAQAGNAAKAVWAYNRMALHAGWVPLKLLNPTPGVFDAGDAIVSFGPEMEILQCR